VALAVLRALEDQLLRDSRSSLVAVTTAEVALYILNNKRTFVTSMEHRHGVSITVEASARMQGANFAIEKSAAPVAPQRAAEQSAAVNMEWGFEGQQAEEAAPAEEQEAQLADTEEEGRRPRRRRRRGGGRRDEWNDQRDRPRQARANGNGEAQDGLHEPPQDQPGDAPRESLADAGEDSEQRHADDTADGGEDRRGRRRRRGRRGGRRGRDRSARDRDDFAEYDEAIAGAAQQAESEAGEERDVVPEAASSPQHDEREPEHDRRQEPQNAAPGAGNGQHSWSAPTAEDLPPAASQPEPEAPRRASEPAHVEPEPEEPARPARKGWWQRRLGGE
jgi:ribonuclease E